MSLARGKYGVEYDARRESDDSSGLGWVVVLAVLAVVSAFAVTVIRRVQTLPDESPVPQEDAVSAPVPPSAAAVPPRPESEPIAARPDVITGATGKVRNLLMKLAEAEKSGDVVRQVNAIEQIRSVGAELPAGLDEDLARRLGELNLRWLFESANAQWVETVKVRPGDSAIRIAREHGSTLASLKKLNPGLDVERLVAGRDLRVMNHPHFTLSTAVGARVVELKLNDKFFKRYALRGPVTGSPGTRELEGRLRNFLAENGIWFNASDRAELELLLARHVVLKLAPAE